MEVVWSIESKFTYDKELEFIFEKWNNKEVVKFIQLVDSSFAPRSSDLFISIF